MRIRRHLFSAVLIIFIVLSQVSSAFADPDIIERVVAIVNDEVVLLSEFNDAYENAVASRTGISKEEFLDEIIDRKLILEQAIKFRFEGSPDNIVSENVLVERYLERRIKAFIHIPFAEVENYYLENPALFKGKSFYDVQNEIESFLVDEKLSIKISEHIKDLRDNAYIRVQLH